MIPSPTKEPLVQRLVRELTARLAAQAHCCPIHGIRLVCAVCEVASTVSRSEEVEIEGLLERTALYQLPWQAWPCARCGAQDITLCLDCYDPVADQAFVGLTPDEEARYAELLIRTMRYTFLPELGDDGRGR